MKNTEPSTDGALTTNSSYLCVSPSHSSCFTVLTHITTKEWIVCVLGLLQRNREINEIKVDILWLRTLCHQNISSLILQIFTGHLLDLITYTQYLETCFTYKNFYGTLNRIVDFYSITLRGEILLFSVFWDVLVKLSTPFLNCLRLWEDIIFINCLILILPWRSRTFGFQSWYEVPLSNLRKWDTSSCYVPTDEDGEEKL